MKAGRGFTLAELLITSALISLISGLLLAIWISSRRLVEKTEGELTVQSRVCEPTLRLAHWLRGALYGQDSPLRRPLPGQTGSVLEFYSCDRLVGELPEVDPRHPQTRIYRVETDPQGAWLKLIDTGGATLAQRRIGEEVQLRFYNLDNYQVEVTASAEVQVRAPNGGTHTQSRTLTTVIAAPHVD